MIKFTYIQRNYLHTEKPGSHVSKRTDSKVFRIYFWPSKVNLRPLYLTALGWKISFIIVTERLFFILKSSIAND